MTGVMGSLKLEPAQSRLDLLADPVAKALAVWPDDAPVDADQVMVAPGCVGQLRDRGRPPG
jgi:hypothetical protein